MQTKLNHMMIDVETLGVTTDTTVIGIGIAMFDPETGVIGATRHYLPPLDGQGGTISFDTIRWWFGKDPELFKRYMLADATLGTPLDWNDISDNISALISANEVDTIWANGIDFDIPILSATFDRCADVNPLNSFNYSQRRDMRQWKFAAQHNGWQAEPRPATLQTHNAMLDAQWQARVVCSLWAFLSK